MDRYRHITAILLALFALDAIASSYYVRKDGSDANTGLSNTSGSAWLTLQKAANTMVGGDTANVAVGIYPEYVTTARSGSSNSHIRFLAESTNVVAGGFEISHSWHNIEGFTLNGTNVGGFDGLVEIMPGANNILIQSNVISVPYRVNEWAQYQYLCYLKAPSASDNSTCSNVVINGNFFGDVETVALLISGTSHVITNNTFSSVFSNVAAYGDRDAVRIFGSNIKISNNTFTNWSSVGAGSGHPDIFQIYSSGGYVSTNILIENNYLANCLGTQLGNFEDQDGSNKVGFVTFRNNVFQRVEYALPIFITDVRFYNCTFYQCGTNTAGPIYWGSQSGHGTNGFNGRVFNCSFVECGSAPASTNNGWYFVNSEYTNTFVADYNLVSGSGAGLSKNSFVQNGWEAHGINGSAPSFVSAPSNLRLSAGSAGYASGTNLVSLFTTDFDGVTRTDPWSIGAFEQDTSGGGGGTATISIGTATVGILRKL